MGSTWKLLNVGAFIALGGHLGSLAVTSISSGHPDSLTCYECRACASPCPWKLDPSGYLVAARVNNPDRRMLAQYNLDRYNTLIGSREPDRLMTIFNLRRRDEYMKVITENVKTKEFNQLFNLSPRAMFLGLLPSSKPNVDDDEYKHHRTGSAIRAVFGSEGISLSEDSILVKTKDSEWAVIDHDGKTRYRILDDGLTLAVSEREITTSEEQDPIQNARLEEKLLGGEDVILTDTYELRAKDSAFFDPLCARCEPACPVALPITKFIRDVKADEKYR
jgi:ferredoxin